MFCWLCGRTASYRPKNWYADFYLELAHIASGGGAARRVDDPRAVVLLCSLCHKCHINNTDRCPTVHVCGSERPTIDERHTLWLKEKLDPEYYDVEFLRTIWIGIPPNPEPPPSVYLESLTNLTGIFLQ